MTLPSPPSTTPVEAAIEGTPLAYTENDGAVAITSSIAITDVDDTNIEWAVVKITGNYATGEDVLAFVDQNGISGSWNPTNGKLSLTGSATLAQYEAALRSVTFENTSDTPSTATRTVSFTVNDGDDISNTLTRDISFTAVNDAPAFSGLDANPTYTKRSAVTLDNDVTVTDAELSGANDFGGSTLTLVRNGGANSEDVQRRRQSRLQRRDS
ncbi:MAG: hypothetical protein R3B96_13785 [Pirellulaceae bacterium]